MAEIARLRSLLFAPASRPDVLASSRGAIPTAWSSTSRTRFRRRQGRRAAARQPDGRRAGDEHIPSSRCTCRVNAIPTDWFASDIAEGCITGARRASWCRSSSVAKRSTSSCARCGTRARPSARRRRRGDRARRRSCAGVPPPAVAAGYFGAEDFIADMGGVRTESSTEVLYARLACRARGQDRRRPRARSGRQPVRRRRGVPRRRRGGSLDRLPGQALHPPGPGTPRPSRVLAVTGGDRTRRPSVGGLRRRHGPGRSCHRVRGADDRRAARAPRPRLSSPRATRRAIRLRRLPTP